jgi:hypothetical protein
MQHPKIKIAERGVFGERPMLRVFDAAGSFAA